MDEILAAILKDTYSLNQFKHRVRIMKFALLKHFFGTVSGTGDESFSASDMSWFKSLPPEFVNKFTKENVYSIFTGLKKEEAKLQVLSLYLAFETNEQSLMAVCTYARKSFDLPVLLIDIKLDPDLIAGASLVWKGRLRDYSLRVQIEEKKAEILQRFKKLLR